MEVQDRGTMKWVSLMLPEHVEMLKGVFVERKNRPILDEQKMVEIDRNLKYALKHQVHVEITYYEDGDYLTIHGRLIKIEQLRGYIVLWNESGSKVALRKMIDVKII